MHGILPDLHVNLEDMIASGDMVGVRGTMRVTHSGPLAGVPATGNELKWNGIAMFRVKSTARSPSAGSTRTASASSPSSGCRPRASIERPGRFAARPPM